MPDIPEDAQRLADRLRLLADELESAARYGVPIPYMVSVDGHEFGFVSFNASEHEFTAWAEYAEAKVEHYEHEGSQWSSAEDHIGAADLPIRFAVQHEPTAVTS